MRELIRDTWEDLQPIATVAVLAFLSGGCVGAAVVMKLVEVTV